jgi:hypothetical protein
METGELVQETSATGFWLNRDAMKDAGITEGEVADFFINYRLEDNIPSAEELPDQYESRRAELLFAAAWPGKHMDRVLRCARSVESD